MKFLLTSELGRLAKWLRILGFDASYINSGNISSIIIEALKQDRIILTRNRHFPRSGGLQIVVITAEKFKDQIKEVQDRLRIDNATLVLFKRCVTCNQLLEPVDKNGVKGLVPEYVLNTQQTFTSCPLCKKIYWQGTHWGNVEDTLKELIRSG